MAAASAPEATSLATPAAVIKCMEAAQRGRELNDVAPLAPEGLVPALYPYQSAAVRWMMDRERGVDGAAVAARAARLFGRDDAGAALDGDGLRGGLLCDEMGLGKTVAVVALRAGGARRDAHRVDDERPPARVRVRLAGRRWDDVATCRRSLRPGGRRAAPRGSGVRLRRLRRRRRDGLRLAIAGQWLGELRSKAPSLVVLEYPGIQALQQGARRARRALSAPSAQTQRPRRRSRLPARADGSAFAEDADVVVATFSALQRDAHYVSRGATPLVAVDWFRCVVDEAQHVQGGASAAAAVARAVRATRRWGVSGTPVGARGLEDLWGSSTFWGASRRREAAGAAARTSAARALVAWRATKRTVVHAIPPQAAVLRDLAFAPVERFVYDELDARCGPPPTATRSRVAAKAEEAQRRVLFHLLARAGVARCRADLAADARGYAGDAPGADAYRLVAEGPAVVAVAFREARVESDDLTELHVAHNLAGALAAGRRRGPTAALRALAKRLRGNYNGQHVDRVAQLVADARGRRPRRGAAPTRRGAVGLLKSRRGGAERSGVEVNAPATRALCALARFGERRAATATLDALGPSSRCCGRTRRCRARLTVLPAALYDDLGDDAVAHLVPGDFAAKDMEAELEGAAAATELAALEKTLAFLEPPRPAATSPSSSNFEEVLDFARALADAELAVARFTPAGVADFTAPRSSIPFLLAPVGRANNGLTLVNATNVFLLEPPTSHAVELQCVNRVHRVGQRRPTTVFRYVVGATVEAAIHGGHEAPAAPRVRRGEGAVVSKATAAFDDAGVRGLDHFAAKRGVACYRGLRSGLGGFTRRKCVIGAGGGASPVSYGVRVIGA
ncbi:hypothetical protein JL720_10558 [Aureococcus anophagefferens]|nr:hypothetical protein JL720_10558 [Aureococcus anophagefferens]